jgi:hypothetical protein
MRFESLNRRGLVGIISEKAVGLWSIIGCHPAATTCVICELSLRILDHGRQCGCTFKGIKILL